jgi:hypothetical protein
MCPNPVMSSIYLLNIQMTLFRVSFCVQEPERERERERERLVASSFLSVSVGSLP